MVDQTTLRALSVRWRKWARDYDEPHRVGAYQRCADELAAALDAIHKPQPDGETLTFGGIYNDPPHCRDDYRDVWRSGFRAGYSAALDAIPPEVASLPVCPACGTVAELTVQWVEESVPFLPDASNIHRVNNATARVPVWTCHACGQSFTDAHAEGIRQAAVDAALDALPTQKDEEVLTRRDSLTHIEAPQPAPTNRQLPQSNYARRLLLDEQDAVSADAIKLLRQIIAPCDGAPSDHGWRKCKRCMAVHGVEMRFPLSIRLLQSAIDSLGVLIVPSVTRQDEKEKDDLSRIGQPDADPPPQHASTNEKD